jgi:hypothetical protein
MNGAIGAFVTGMGGRKGNGIEAGAVVVTI